MSCQVVLWGCVCSTGGWIGCRPPSVACVLGPFERGAGVIGRDGDGANFLAEKQPAKQHFMAVQKYWSRHLTGKRLKEPKKTMLVFSNFPSVANNGKRRRQVVSSQLRDVEMSWQVTFSCFPPCLLSYKSCSLRLYFCFFSSYCSFKALPFLTVRGTKLTQCSKQKKKEKKKCNSAQH